MNSRSIKSNCGDQYRDLGWSDFTGSFSFKRAWQTFKGYFCQKIIKWKNTNQRYSDLLPTKTTLIKQMQKVTLSKSRSLCGFPEQHRDSISMQRWQITVCWWMFTGLRKGARCYEAVLLCRHWDLQCLCYIAPHRGVLTVWTESVFLAHNYDEVIYITVQHCLGLSKNIKEVSVSSRISSCTNWVLVWVFWVGKSCWVCVTSGFIEFSHFWFINKYPRGFLSTT